MIKFTKMHGLGNDYVFTYLGEYFLTNPEILAKKISNRNFGVGSDGLITISKSDIADFKMQIFNADGSEGNMCGNGIRCVGKFVWDKKLTKKQDLLIETKSGIKKIHINVNEKSQVKSVQVEMGIAKIIDSINLVLDGTKYKMYFVDIGNVHGVLETDEDVNIKIKKYGKYICELFEEKINVEFVKVLNNNEIKMGVYERGSGITLACGTGASAGYFVLYKQNKVASSGKVKLLNGNLNISVLENDNVIMQGEAVTTFEGKYYNS